MASTSSCPGTSRLSAYSVGRWTEETWLNADMVAGSKEGDLARFFLFTLVGQRFLKAKQATMATMRTTAPSEPPIAPPASAEVKAEDESPNPSGNSGGSPGGESGGGGGGRDGGGSTGGGGGSTGGGARGHSIGGMVDNCGSVTTPTPRSSLAAVALGMEVEMILRTSNGVMSAALVVGLNVMMTSIRT